MRLWLVAAFVVLAHSQQTPTPAPPPQTFRSGTQLVEVDVRVLKDGRFVTDLGLGDFQISEDGVPQKIQSVTLVGAASAAVAPSAPGTEHQAQSTHPIPGTEHAAPAVWLFVFDTNHLSAGGLQRTRDAVVAFVKDRFRHGDMGGVVSEGNMINGRLTTDREELRKAATGMKLPGDTRPRLMLQREWPRLRDDEEAELYDRGDASTMATAVDRACAEDADFCNRPHGKEAVEAILDGKARNAVVDARVRATRSITSIDLICKGLARIPGAKSIVFLSEGFRIEGREGELRLAVGQAARAGAHFYTIDARGLDKTGGAIVDQVVAFDSHGPSNTFDMQADGTNSLAVDTGGMAIRNENNFSRALDIIQQDAGTYYVVAYAPSNAAFDGKYRAIDVKVSRAGVKVRARRGYLALEPAALLTRRAITRAPPAAGVPDVPVSPGVLTLREDVSIAVPLPAGRMDTGKIVAALRKDPASARLRPSGTGTPAAERGWAAYEKGDVETASRELGEAAKSPDARPWVIYALGLSQFALRQYRDSAQSWERVRRDAPEFEPIYFSLADAYGLQHDERSALKVLRDAESRWPADAEVENAIGVIHVRRGAFDAAIESFEKATKVAPADALGYFNLARTHQMRLMKSQRYDKQMEKWVGGDEDRRRAIANFEKYLQLGGPYERQAKEALAALAWK